jgi:hypothetical protein
MNIDEELFNWLKTRAAEIDEPISELNLVLKGRKLEWLMKR